MEYDMEIKRDFYLNKLIKHKKNGMVKVITGVRRSGKLKLMDAFAFMSRENGPDGTSFAFTAIPQS